MAISEDDAGLMAARKHAIPNPLKLKMEANELAHSCSAKFVGDIEVAHFIAHAGYDAILVDLEHGSFGLDVAKQLSIAALHVGITPIIRVPGNSSDWISRALDGGAQAVIVPHVQNAEEARNVVKYARFQPFGERSATGGMPAMRYSDAKPMYANQVCNENITVICMIESVRAVELVDEIAAVPGVDVLLVGHGDLTQDFGIPGEYDDPRIEDAFAKICAAARKHSVDGRKVFVGMGGLHNRPDLQERRAKQYPEARFAMSGADHQFLLAGIMNGAKVSKAVTEAVKKG